MKNPTTENRQQLLTNRYLNLIDFHILDLAAGKCDTVMTLKQVADKLFVHPRHLSNVVKGVTGYSTCYHFEMKLVKLARQLLLNPDSTIKHVALSLNYDPSNFTKFFKQYTGETPSDYRKEHLGKY
jgi:AraC family transcriptional regulator of adaptative response / methylphosphotriester-DNA alkyltransferase methyltransferase